MAGRGSGVLVGGFGMKVAVGIAVGGGSVGTTVKVGIGKVGSGVSVPVGVGVFVPESTILNGPSVFKSELVLPPPDRIAVLLKLPPGVLGALTVKVTVSTVP